MCYVCEAMRDLRVLSSAMMLLNTIDYGRAKMAMGMIGTDMETLMAAAREETASGFVVNLFDVFSEEDDLDRAISTTLMLISTFEQVTQDMNEMLVERGPMIVPSKKETITADAFDEFLSDMFAHIETEDEDE